MATAAHSTHEPLAVRAWNDDGEADSKSERYLARRLAAASADFKGVALITFLLGAGVAALLWVAGGVALEHWLVAGGLPRWARWTWLLAGLIALATAAVRWIVPLVRYRVNLVYAAHVIEREHPELHNDIVNTVLVKASPEGNAAPVVRSLERRAAKRLSAVPAETIIDRTAAVRLAYALALLVGLACIYSLAAPKSMLVTAARLVAPWSRLAAPTRVGIESPRLRWRMPGEAAAVAGQPADAGGAADSRSIRVDAGRATLVRGRQLVVSSVIHGLRRDERPTILVTPLLDGGAVDRAAVPWRAELTRMAGEGDGALYTAVLPDTARGLDQSLSFSIQAGDAKSEPIGVALVDSPSLLVRQVRYEFPPYMRRENETVPWQGDLRGVEGTRVVIMAESNQPLESAWIDFGCDGSRDLKLKVGASDLARATGAFVLLLNADRTTAEHSRYRLVFQPKGGPSAGPASVETEKLEHRIEVLADLAPEISIEEPRESPLRVPPGAPVAVRVRALDPDFGLARVAIETRLQDGAIRPEIVLPGSERTGAFNGVVQLVPERLGAGPGGKLEYRGVAVDTRPNPPNLTHTPWRVLQIDASAAPRQPEKPLPPSRERRQDRQDGGSGDNRDDGQEESGASGEDDAPGEQGQPSAAAQDGSGEPRASDGQREPQNGKSGGPEKSGDPQRQGSGQRPQRKEPQSGDRQGEPQPGQQNGAASGNNKGGEQPQAGANAARGGSQGQGGEPGQTTPSGQGRGAEGRSGGNDLRDGQQDDGKQGRGGQEQAGKSGESRQAGGDRQADGDRQGEDKGGKRAADGKPQSGRPDGRRGGDQPAPRAAVAADGTNDGEAMERILEHRRQSGGGEAARDKTAGGDAGRSGEAAAGNRGDERGDKPGEKNASDQAGDRAEGSAGKRPGDRRSGERGEGGDRGGDQNEPKDGGEQQHAERDSPACANAEGQPCGKAGCKSCGGGSKPSGGSAGGQAGGQGEGSDGQSQQGQSEGRDSQGQRGQGQQGQGEGREGQGQQGQGEGREGQGQQGQGQQGQVQQGQGEGREGQGQQGQGQQGQGEGQGQQGQGDGAAGSEGEPGQQQGGQPAAGPKGGGAAKAKGDPDQQGKAGGKAGGQQAAGAPPQGATESSPVGGGGWSEGAATPQAGAPAAEDARAARDMEWGAQELENARNAADLAIEHLRTTVESGRTDVLDELGWTRDQARAFLERWEAMRRQAADPDPRKRGEFDRGLRSLGLRAKGVQSSRDVPADVKGGQAEGRRSRPPSDYRERFKAFLQGTSGGQNADARGAGSP